MSAPQNLTVAVTDENGEQTLPRQTGCGMTWLIYSNGSADPSQKGLAGWGAVVITPDGNRHEYFGPVPEPSASVNRAELWAIKAGLAEVPRGATVIVISDSLLSVNLVAGKWRGKANRDLIALARHEAGLRRTTLKWIKAHNGHPENERADELANMGREQAAEAATTRAAWDDDKALQRTLNRWHGEAAGW